MSPNKIKRTFDSWRNLRRIFYILTFPPLGFEWLRHRAKARQVLPPINLREIKNILVFRLDHTGDVVMTTPFLRELRQAAPQAHITIIVRDQTVDLLTSCPYVNEILTCAFDTRDDWKKFFKYFSHLLQTYRLGLGQLRKRNFNLAILPRSDADYHQATFLAYLSGAHRRVGYTEHLYPWKARATPGFDALLTDVITPTEPKHEVENTLDLLRYLGAKISQDNLELWLEDSHLQFQRDFFMCHKISSIETLVVFGIGAAEKKRQWPKENFIELGQRLQKKFACRIVLIGGKEDSLAAKQIQEGLGSTSINLAGKATFRQTAAILKMCHLFIGNDSGPMHLAAAAGIPVLEISCHPQTAPNWHPNSPKLYGPWGIPNVILQPKQTEPACQKGCMSSVAHCINHIQIEQVIQSLKPFKNFS